MTLNRARRVAVVGAGATGVHTTDLLVCMSDHTFFVDLFSDSPAPISLIRFAAQHRSARSRIDVPRVRLFGNIRPGTDVTIGELTHYYDTVVVASDGALTVVGTTPEAAEVYALLAERSEQAASRTPIVVEPAAADQPGAIVALLETRGIPFTSWQGWFRPALAEAENSPLTTDQWSDLLASARSVPAIL